MRSWRMAFWRSPVAKTLTLAVALTAILAWSGPAPAAEIRAIKGNRVIVRLKKTEMSWLTKDEVRLFSFGGEFALVGRVVKVNVGKKFAVLEFESVDERIKKGIDVTDADIFWTPTTDPGMLIFATPPTVPKLTGPILEIDPSGGRRATEGLYIHLAAGNARFDALWLGVPSPRGPVAVILPLDDLLHDRTEALHRYHKALRRLRAPADPRLTPQQRRNLRQALQAVDGRLAGATYQEIGEAVCDAERVTAIVWKSAPLRDTTMRRVREGMRLVNGAYRHLLHHRRPR